MSWSIGYDDGWSRDIGYGVPAVCDHPECNEPINRGLVHVCGNQDPYGGEDGCGLYFCHAHGGGSLCSHCANEDGETFDPKPDTAEWIQHKLTHPSWLEWRAENPEWVEKCQGALSVEQRKHQIEQICRWYDVPSSIIDGF